MFSWGPNHMVEAIEGTIELKGIGWPFEPGARLHAHVIHCNKLKARQDFVLNFNETISREEH
jgi:hypothetical protein